MGLQITAGTCIMWVNSDIEYRSCARQPEAREERRQGMGCESAHPGGCGIIYISIIYYFRRLSK